MNADDLLLISGSICDIQHIVGICAAYGSKNDIIFDNKKSVCIRFGPNSRGDTGSLYLGSNQVYWVSSIKYLGVTF